MWSLAVPDDAQAAERAGRYQTRGADSKNIR